MTRTVLSIGSNLGGRLGHLQSVVDGLGSSVVAVSPVYETAPWGGVEQQRFLNAIVVADDVAVGCWDWLARGAQLERAADRVRGRRWGPRTLDVDVITCHDGSHELARADEVLTLPHPRAHQRAFVLIPWLAVDRAATLTVDGSSRRVADLLDGLDPAEREGVRLTSMTLHTERSSPARRPHDA